MNERLLSLFIPALMAWRNAIHRTAGLFLCIGSCILLHSCANIVAPEGGPRDSQPPVLLKAEPPNQSLQFTSKTIRLTFNEYVQLKDLSRNLLLSPPMEKLPESRIKGKSILLTLEGVLLENTTYQLNFGPAIQDYTEGNPLLDFTYVFSTGSSIDTFALAGTVLQAENREPAKSKMVLLFPDMPDSVLLATKPRYVSRTKDKGTFLFKHLAQGKYRILAVEDANQDLMADLPAEAIGFSDSLVTAVPEAVIARALQADSAGLLTLYMYQEKDSKRELLKAYFEKSHHLLLPFSNAVTHCSLHLLEEPQGITYPWYTAEWNTSRDTMTCWISPDFKADSLHVRLEVEGLPADSLHLDFKRVGRTARARKDKEGEKTFQARALSPAVLRPDQAVELEFPYPLLSYRLEECRLLTKTDTQAVMPLFTDSLKRRLQLKPDWQENTAFHFIIPKASLENYLGQKNDSILVSFSTKAASDYGKFSLHFDGKQDEAVVLQLLAGKEKIVARKSGIGSFTWEIPFLEPGQYKLRLIHDNNNNSRWDGGNYHLKIQPERVEYYPKTLEIRGNWEVEESWKP